MKRLVLVLAATAIASLTAACDNGSAAAKQALLQQCTTSGQSQAQCSCMVDKFAAALPPAQLAIMAKGDAATPEERNSVMQNPQFAAAATQAFSCAALPGA